jgi:hypothetical protein
MLYLKVKLIVWANTVIFVLPSDKLLLVTVARYSVDELPEVGLIKMNCLLRTKDMFIDMNV